MVTKEKIKCAALIVAGGRGTRAGAGVPKQYRPIVVAGMVHPVLAATCNAFLIHDKIDAVQVVIHADDSALYHDALAALPQEKLLPVVFGGETRQSSVFAGLNALKPYAPQHVLIHDGARPFVSVALIERVYMALHNGSADGVIAARPIADTLKHVENNMVTHTVNRDKLYGAQTPQGFRFDALYTTYENAPSEMTDDAALSEKAGLNIVVVDGEAQNKKLTFADEFEPIAHYVSHMGMGVDVHAFCEDKARPLMLCGVEIEHALALAGHSDADVGLHALCDALYGALGAGDIGEHFPPSDMAHKDRPSADFLAHACALVKARGGKITNCDITFICETPKLTPYKPVMREKLATLLGIAETAINVKATTTERLGFTGRKEGITAMAVATLLLPS